MATSGGDAANTDSDFLKELLQKGIKEKSIEHLTKHDVDSKEALCAVDIDELKELNLSVGQKAILRKIKQDSEGKKPKQESKKKSTKVKSESSSVPAAVSTEAAIHAAWQWRSDDGTAWTSYSEDISDFLEQLSKQGLQTIDLSTTKHKLPYTVDMKAMTQTRNDSGTKRPIRRKTGPRDQNTSDAAGYDVTWSLQDMTPASFPLWEWAEDSGKDWEMYDNEVAEYLEQQHSQGVTSVDLSQSQFKLPYTINFTKMEQKRNNTGRVRKIRRTLLTDHTVAVSLQRDRYTAPPSTYRGLEIPQTWEPMHNQTFSSPDVKPGTVEFQQVEAQFTQSMINQGRCTVYRITRIQNMALWEFYNVKKKQMIEELGEGNINELQLFHGTKRSVMESICKNNFDWRHCGTNGTAYGQGSYFAVDASYSHQYTEGTPPNQSTLNIMQQRYSGLTHQRVHKMFIAKVLCGRYTKGNSSMRTPPPVNPVNSRGQNRQPCGIQQLQQARGLFGLKMFREPNNLNGYSNQGGISQYNQPGFYNQGVVSPPYSQQQQSYSDEDDEIFSSLQGTNAGPFYDSCVDQTQNPRVYVIFEKTQCYPAYIIEYGF